MRAVWLLVLLLAACGDDLIDREEIGAEIAQTYVRGPVTYEGYLSPEDAYEIELFLMRKLCPGMQPYLGDRRCNVNIVRDVLRDTHLYWTENPGREPVYYELSLHLDEPAPE